MNWVSLCVNNDYGNLSGECCAVDVHEDNETALDLKHYDMLHGPKFRQEGDRDNGRVRIHRQWFTCRFGACHVGNLYWNAYGFEDAEFLRFLKTLKRSGGWQNEGGLVSWDTWWERLTDGTMSLPSTHGEKESQPKEPTP